MIIIESKAIERGHYSFFLWSKKFDSSPFLIVRSQVSSNRCRQNQSIEFVNYETNFDVYIDLNETLNRLVFVTKLNQIKFISFTFS